jgi:hypothetical protein
MELVLQVVFVLDVLICAAQIVRHWGTPSGIGWSVGALACSFGVLWLSGG